MGQGCQIMDNRRAGLTVLTLTLVFSCNAQAELASQIEQMWQARLYDQAYHMLQNALEEDPTNPTTHKLMAQSYAEGLGTTANPARHISHLRQAAKAGHTGAMYTLGEAYANGEGATRTPMSAMYWFEKAAPAHPKAAFRYAEITLANADAAQGAHDPIEMLRYAADHHVAPAQYLLARLLVAGEISKREQDDPGALLTEAAKTLPEARTAMGVIAHRAGRHDAAAQTFIEARAGGDRRAAAYLGHYAEAGISRAVDRESAMAYYQEAIDIPWAREGAARIERHMRSPNILGFRVYWVTREEVRETIGARGISRVDGAAYFDAYDVSELFPQAEQATLTTAYAPGQPGFLAELYYRIDAPNTREVRQLWNQIEQTMEQRYGAPVSHTREQGVHMKIWRIDWTKVQLRMTPRDTRIHVIYHMKPFVDQLAQVLQQQTEDAGARNHVF